MGSIAFGGLLVTGVRTGMLVSTYRRGDRLLLVIGSFAKSSVELPLQLRKGRIVRAVDLEADKPLVCERGAASLTLKPHDFALVELREVEML